MLYILDLELHEYVYIGLSAILFFVFVYLLGYFIRKSIVNKTPTFNSTMLAFKTTQLAIIINLLDDKVEKYYSYNSSKTSQITTYEEFCYSFDSTNINRLQTWLQNIQDNFEFGGNRRIELVMTDESKKKRVYRFSLENYFPETQKFFIRADDVTESSSTMKRYEKTFSSYDLEMFFEKVFDYERLQDDKHKDCITFITYRELKTIDNDFKGDLVKLLDFAILTKIDKLKLEEEIICQYKDGQFVLYTPNISDIKSFKKRIKKMLIKCSGTIATVKRRFDINLVGGINMLSNQSLTTEKIIQAQVAANQCLKKSFINERIVVFNDELSKKETEKLQRLQTIRKIVEGKKIEITYTPFINREWKVNGYCVDLSIDDVYGISRDELFDGAQEMGIRKVLASKIFDDVCQFTNSTDAVFVINFNFKHLGRILEVYQSNSEYLKVNMIFALEFNRNDINSQSLRIAEKIMGSAKKSTSVKFAISNSEICLNYLTDTIYHRANYLILRGKLIDNSLDSFYNRSVLEIHGKIAKQYNLKLFGFDIKNMAQFECLYNLGVVNFSGQIFNLKILKGQVNDTYLLKLLDEIKNRGK